MSASNKKKLRKEQNAQVMTERQKQEKAEARKNRSITAVFIIVIALVFCIFIGIIGLICVVPIIYVVSYSLTPMAEMLKRGGFVLNVCSIASFCPNTRMTVYSSTKAYVMSFSRGLREELKPHGINVLAVCPGPMKTEFLDVANITERSPMFKTLPYSDPDKVADTAVVKAAKGRCVYTHKGLFKFYRVLAKLLPHSLMMKFCKT